MDDIRRWMESSDRQTINPIFTLLIFSSWLWILINQVIEQYQYVDPLVVYLSNALLIIGATRLIFIKNIFITVIALSFDVIAINNILMKSEIIDENLYAIDVGVGFFLISMIWCFLSNNNDKKLPVMDHVLTYMLLLVLAIFSVSIAMESSAFIYVCILVVFLIMTIYFLSHISDALTERTKNMQRLKWTAICIMLFLLILFRILHMYKIIDKKVLAISVLAFFFILSITEMIRFLTRKPDESYQSV